MKGIICAGGSGSRLSPLTDVTNKHLLPVYNKPMIFYPLYSLLEAGIKEIMIVCSSEHTGPFQRLLGSGSRFGVDISFKVQDESGGIAEAIGLCKGFAAGDDVSVILGDNIFSDSFNNAVESFKHGSTLFLKQVSDANRFGVAEIVNGKVVSIEEKPKEPKSDYAITGFYIYDNRVFDVIKSLDYSARGELEITDVNNFYIKDGSANAIFLDGDWTDAGTFESLFRASSLARDLQFKFDSINSARVPVGLEKKVMKSVNSDVAV